MLRRYTVLDYPIVKTWADARKFPLVPQEFLPSIGFIHENYCVGFLYKTDSKICWLEWVISNPVSDKPARDKALNELLSALVEIAHKEGFKAIFSSLEHKGLIERYNSLGFVETDKGMTNMVRRL
jgi:hypothetical protein